MVSAILKLTYVAITIVEYQRTFAMVVTMLKISCVMATILVCIFSLTMKKAILKTTFVVFAFGRDVFTVTV